MVKYTGIAGIQLRYPESLKMECDNEIHPIAVGSYRYSITKILLNDELDKLKIWCEETYSSNNKIKEFFGIHRYKISYCTDVYNRNAIYTTFRNVVYIMFKKYDDAVMFKLAWNYDQQ